MTTTRDLLDSVIKAHNVTLRWFPDPSIQHGLQATLAIPTLTAHQICRDLLALGVQAHYSPDFHDAAVAWLYVIDARV